MKALTTAIYSRFTESQNDFYDLIGGRLFEHEAPEGSDFPYAVYTIVSSASERTFSERLTETLIQFSLFSSSSSSGEVKDIYDSLKKLYDECALTITDPASTLLWMRESNLAPMIDDVITPSGTVGVKHWAVDYEVLVSKD